MCEPAEKLNLLLSVSSFSRRRRRGGSKRHPDRSTRSIQQRPVIRFFEGAPVPSHVLCRTELCERVENIQGHAASMNRRQIQRLRELSARWFA